MPLNLKDGKPRNFSGGPVVKTQASKAASAGSIPGRGTKILHAAPRSQEKKKVESPHSDAQEDIEVRTGINKKA